MYHNPQVASCQLSQQLTLASDISIIAPQRRDGTCMVFRFSADFDGNDIVCQLSTDVTLETAVLCFSMMAEPRVVRGGTIIKSVAGYAEVALPKLAADQIHTLVLSSADPNFYPRNRAWMPLQPYLRVAGQCHPLPPATPLGAKPGALLTDAAHLGRSLPLVPPPTNWLAGSGTLFATSFSNPDPRLVVINNLAERMHLAAPFTSTGTQLSITRDRSLPAEAYRLRIRNDTVAIEHADEHGLHNAAITLLNLRETTAGKILCGDIEDRPRFSYRGQHLDCARHFFTVDSILRLLDLMALLKLNRFHWHFADDEAFRLEVDCFPDLWKKTAYRGEGEVVSGVFGGGIRAGGTYSKADVATILKRAAELHIEVLPEIEVPAHCYAVNKVIPGLRDPEDTGDEHSIQGYPQNILNPAMPQTWHFLEKLSLEVAQLFPGCTVHLGGDELPPNAWAGSPAVAALKEREGLVTSVDVQGWIMGKLADHLTRHGVKTAAWEEASHGITGGIGNNALIFSWTGQGAGIAAARRGHDVVMCPAQHVYLDHAHTADQHDWGATWAGITPLEKTVEWDPVPANATDIANRVIGVQGCFWAEFTTADSQLAAMLVPRILGVACKAWEQDRRTNAQALHMFAAQYTELFKHVGWHHTEKENLA